MSITITDTIYTHTVVYIRHSRTLFGKQHTIDNDNRRWSLYDEDSGSDLGGK